MKISILIQAFSNLPKRNVLNLGTKSDANRSLISHGTTVTSGPNVLETLKELREPCPVMKVLGQT